MGTPDSAERLLPRMGEPRQMWLIDNESSGSNNEDALRLLEETCGEAGFHVAHRTHFPRYKLPTPAMLDAGGIDVVAVFAGDGTINATINHLAGWSGAVLVLPGGTMNLLYHRLHGERDMHEVVRAAAAGEARRIRPTVIRGAEWDGLAGVMAGPGTSWNRVREAMRDVSIIDMAGNAIEAIEETLSGAQIVCREPPFGRREGYPLVLLNPVTEGIEVVAYHAETAREYLEQSFALVKRDFREGPHDRLGVTDRLVLASSDVKPFGLLVDGEPADVAKAEIALESGECGVDLLTTELHA